MSEHAEDRPRVVLNYAMSLDGKIAFPGGARARLSCEEDMRRVHLLRNEVDAILVGVGTVLADDPSLRVKERFVPEPHHPLRIILDSRGRTPETARCLGKGECLIVTSDRCERSIPHAEMLRCGGHQVDLHRLMSSLTSRGVRNLLVEGGSRVLWSFLSAGLLDELYVYAAPLVIGGTRSPTPAAGPGFTSIEECPPLQYVSVERLGEGVLLHAVPRKGS